MEEVVGLEGGDGHRFIGACVIWLGFEVRDGGFPAPPGGGGVAAGLAVLAPQ